MYFSLTNAVGPAYKNRFLTENPYFWQSPFLYEYAHPTKSN